MKYFIAVLTVFTLFNFYTALRSAAWSNMVAAPYMAAQYETVRCNKYRAAEASKQWFCPIDKEACQKATKMWEDYEISREEYAHHKWWPFLKQYFTSINRQVLGAK